MNATPTTPTTTSRRPRALTAVLAAGALAAAVPAGVLAASPASADDERSTEGRCGTLRYDLSVERDDDRRGVHEIDVDLDNAARGTTWRIDLFHNGNRVSTVKRQADREREIDVAWDRRERSGTDTWTVRATNGATDRVCTFRVRL